VDFNGFNIIFFNFNYMIINEDQFKINQILKEEIKKNNLKTQY
jgi:hypothetical protein